MPRRKNDIIAGMEAFLNNPDTTYANPHVFNEIHKQSGMSVSEMLKHVGRNSRNIKVKEPSDKEMSQERLKTLELKTEK